MAREMSGDIRAGRLCGDVLLAKNRHNLHHFRVGEQRQRVSHSARGRGAAIPGDDRFSDRAGLDRYADIGITVIMPRSGLCRVRDGRPGGYA